MPIIESKDKFCPKCGYLLKSSSRGPVCRYPLCEDYLKYPESVPQIPIVPKINSQQMKSGKKGPRPKNIRCCPNANFDVKTMLESMIFIGSVQSRANEYFCYENSGLFLISTGIKEMTRFNVVRQEEIDDASNLIQSFPCSEPFSAEDLKKACLSKKCRSSRINEIRRLTLQNKDEFNQLYWLMLSCCYINTAQGDLNLIKKGHGIQFIRNEQTVKRSKNDSIYNRLQYLNNINEKTAVFTALPFFFEVRCNGYRGSIVPYIDEEIEYLSQLVDDIPPRQRLDIAELMNSMDYSHRFHRLYDLLEFRNIRNDREEREFFERRIKSALELVSILKHTLKVGKKGRIKIFTKM